MIVSDVKVHYGVFDESILTDTKNEKVSSVTPFTDDLNNLFTIENRQKLAYLEKDYFLLNGQHIFPAETLKYNLGWESNNISDTDGNINEYIEFDFTQVHSSFGVMLYFAENSLVRDFTVKYYNDTVLLKTHEITGNTSANLILYEIIESWNKVVLTVTKTQAQQRARLLGVYFGIGSDLDKNALINVDASVVTDIASDSFECGDFSFKFVNQGGIFSLQNIKDMPLALQENIMATIFVKFNNAVNWTTFGKYNSNEIKIEENGTLITISGYDELYNLNTTIFKKGKVYPNGRSLYDWALEVAEDCDVDIVIDDSFKTIISTGYITEVPHREAFRLIAEAGNGYLWIDSNSVIHIDKYTETTPKNLNQDDIVDDSITVDSSERYFGIQVSRFAYSPTQDVVSGGLGYLEEVSLTSEPQEIEIVYSQYPAVVDTVRVLVDPTSSAVLENVRIYSDRCVFDLSGTDGDTTWVTVTGKAYNQAIIFDSAGSLLKSFKKIESNYLITGDIGKAVANYQNNLVVNKRDYSAEIVKDNDIINLGDSVNLDEDEIITERVIFSVEYGGQTVTVGGVRK